MIAKDAQLSLLFSRSVGRARDNLAGLPGSSGKLVLGVSPEDSLIMKKVPVTSPFLAINTTWTGSN